MGLLPSRGPRDRLARVSLFRTPPDARTWPTGFVGRKCQHGGTHRPASWRPGKQFTSPVRRSRSQPQQPVPGSSQNQPSPNLTSESEFVMQKVAVAQTMGPPQRISPSVVLRQRHRRPLREQSTTWGQRLESGHTVSWHVPLTHPWPGLAGRHFAQSISLGWGGSISHASTRAPRVLRCAALIWSSNILRAKDPVPPQAPKRRPIQSALAWAMAVS